MALGAAYEEEAVTALANSAMTPRAAPAERKFSAWKTVTGVARGVTEAAAQVMGSAADIAGGFGQVAGAYPELLGPAVPLSGDQRRQADAQRQRLLTEGVEMSSEAGDLLRQAGRGYRPDPVTAHAAEQVVYGFSRGAAKVIGGALAMGPAGVLAAGAEEGMSAADDLRLQGVGLGARTAAGAVQGAGLALAALPLIGQTKLATAGLYAAGGPGGFIAQQAATREILQNAGYEQIGAQFDPFDPVGLAVATLLPAGFAAYGLRQQRLQRAADSLPDLPPRTDAAPPAEPAAAVPFPSAPSAVTRAVRAYPTEVVDAARVSLLAQARAAANPGAADNLRAMAQHEAALARAEDQIAAGEPVQVADVAPAALPLRVFGRVAVDPATLVFRESDQARLDQVREDFPGDEYHPVVLIVGESGERSILDGHNRAVVAEERGHSLPAVEISDAEYTALQSAGFDDMEIAFAALMRAGERDAADALDQQFRGARVAARGDDALDVLREQGQAAPYQAWTEQVTAALREIQAQARPTNAPTTPQAANPEAAAPARGAGGAAPAAGAADAGGSAAGVEAAGLSDNARQDAAQQQARGTADLTAATDPSNTGAAAEAGRVRSDAGPGVRQGAEPAGAEAGLIGSGTSAITERGLTVPLRYRLTEAGDLTTSHTNDLTPNPAFPAELQPRDRARAASAEQISRIENAIRPELLGESVKASDGAPIVGPDAVVESGNARTIALRRAYERGRADAYRAWLADNAERFGLTRQQVDAMRQPVLVRERLGDVDRAEFARQANESAVAAMSPTEQAMSDARRLTDLTGLVANEDGTVNMAQSGDFVRLFIQQAVAPTERGMMLQADGRLSQAGMNRLRNAVFAKAYGDADILAMLTESTDANVRNILAGMLRAAPDVARLADLAQAGARQDADIAGPLVEAVRLFSQLRSEGRTVQQFLAQGSMFGDGLAPEIQAMLEAVSLNARAPKRIAEMITGMVQRVDALGDARQGSMFDDAPTGSDAVAGAAKLAVMDSRIAAAQEQFPALAVMVDGMEAPMPAAEFLAAAKAEADELAADAPLMRVAAECALLNGPG